MVFFWPILHAVAALVITSWDVLPPDSKIYDAIPKDISRKLSQNVSLDRIITEWVFDRWRWEPPLSASVALTWVNGINYTSAEVEEQAAILSSLFGCRVRPYYNPSLGWWLKDLTRVSYMYIRAPTEDPVVTGLAKHLSAVLKEVGPMGRVVHLAHSGGALLTYLVAKYHLKDTDRRRIDVINFGGARSITRKYFGKAVNYYARNDPILLVNRRAATLMSKLMNQTNDGEVIYLKHNTSFVFLRGRAQSPLADHSFIGPTYIEALQREATAFRNYYYRPYWFDALKTSKPPEMSWARYIRKRTAAATGLHNFFSNGTYARAIPLPSLPNVTIPIPSLPTVNTTTVTAAVLQRTRRVRKLAARLTGIHHYFSGNRSVEALRARNAAAIAEEIRERALAERRSLSLEETPISALLEGTEGEGLEGLVEEEDDISHMMDVEEIARRYFDT